MPDVSICLPVYQGESYLRKAIDSALRQTFTDFELIIVDDCSTDSSGAIMEECAGSDSRIRVFRNQSNLGLFANYNAAMERASGRFIKLFAQDDSWDPRMLERCVAALEENGDASLVATARIWVDHSGTPLPIGADFQGDQLVSGKQVIMDCLRRRKNMIGEPSTVMFRRELCGSGFNVEYYHLGDLEFWFRLLLKGELAYIDEPLCAFRRHRESTTDKNIKGLLFALDYFGLANGYGALLQDEDISLENLKIGIAQDVARFVLECSQQGVVTLEELLGQQPAEGRQLKQLAQFKELAFYALLAAAKSEQAAWDSNRVKLTQSTDAADEYRWPGDVFKAAARRLRNLVN